MREEKLLKLLKKQLLAYNVAEDEANAFLQDFQDLKTKSGEDDEAENENAPEIEEDKGEETEPTTSEVPNEQEPVKNDGEVEEDEETVEKDSDEQEQPVEPVPQESQEPIAPAVDYGAKFDEYTKALEGLNAKINSLADALQKSGLLLQSPQAAPIGMNGDNSNSPANVENRTNILNDLNKKCH